MDCLWVYIFFFDLFCSFFNSNFFFFLYFLSFNLFDRSFAPFFSLFFLSLHHSLVCSFLLLVIHFLLFFLSLSTYNSSIIISQSQLCYKIIAPLLCFDELCESRTFTSLDYLTVKGERQPSKRMRTRKLSTYMAVYIHLSFFISS